ncbi:MAG: hypothetical protein GY953_47520 [bacterium]|nr:hypothetical protein [bacterium]
MDWLGAGGKTSAGYGVFDSGDNATTGKKPLSPESRPQPPPSKPENLVWQGALLTWVPNERRLEATHGQLKAGTADGRLLETLPEEERGKLTRKRNRRSLRCEVRVRKRGTRWEIVEVRL